MKLSLLVSICLSCLLLLPPTLAASTPVAKIQEWQVPWPDSRPRDPYVAGPDRIWFVGQKGDYVASFKPSDEDFKRYDLAPGTGPHNLIVDKRGVWYAGNQAAHIGLLEPDTGNIDKFTLPGEGRRDVHTLHFDSKGNIWFTVQWGNQVGYFDANSKTFRTYEVATDSARPYGIIVHQDQPWIAYFASNKLATIKNDQLVELPLPRKQTLPRRLAVTPDNNIWYVDYGAGYLGRVNPDSGAVKEWRTPAAQNSRPYAMASDSKGWLWLVETGVQPNRLVGFNSQTETFSEPVPIPSGGGAIRHMVYDADSHSLWFGTDANTLGQARLNN
ncbi:Vgb family protein [Bowmanella dokdonensis]|uniref:Lyase n=1 Tax=Bowmanella dokdonensis TaxID=751969 RepID=A0A939DPE4_9ALTE|nr:lyase [Bowmanella dokdonensis]MBN7826238.1 lyase [Bowmanella dokdonensis]